MKQPDEHSQWDDVLQDWLDGELNDAASAAFEAHLAACGRCQRSLPEFERLEEALVESAPQLKLDANFDQALLAQIDAIDESKRM